MQLNLNFINGPFSHVALSIFISSILAQGNPMNESVCMNGPKKFWKTAFKKCESVWSAKANHIPTNFLKAVIHKFYSVYSWVLYLQLFIILSVFPFMHYRTFANILWVIFKWGSTKFPNWAGNCRIELSAQVGLPFGKRGGSWVLLVDVHTHEETMLAFLKFWT